jgi:hypothetical protein
MTRKYTVPTLLLHHLWAIPHAWTAHAELRLRQLTERALA